MYGTVARVRVKPEDRDALRSVMDAQAQQGIPGMVTSYVLWENEGDAAWLLAIFEDRDAYYRNADDPAQHERYLQYRALLEDEPEWHDGEIERA